MTVQQAAHKILEEKNSPMSAKEISKIILDRKWKSSGSKDPITSLAQTLEKNIRDGIYNEPRLIFIHSDRGRLIGLPSWNNGESRQRSISETKEIKLTIPTTLMDKIQLAVQAKIADSFDDTMIKVLQKGLSAMGPEIKEGLVQQLNKLDEVIEI